MKVILQGVLVFGVITLSSSDVIRFPSSPLLCKEICKTLCRCSNPLFEENHLLCVLEHTNNYPSLVPLTYNQQNTSCFHTSGTRMQLLVSKSGRIICLLADIKRKRETRKTKPKRLIKNEKFRLKIPPDVDPKCKFVRSMTRSDLHPGVIYLLIWCKVHPPGFGALLQAVNITTKELLKHTWELERNSRDLFTGACVKRKGRCLYSLKYKKNLLVITYQEPALGQESLKMDVNASGNKLFKEKTICASHIDDQLFCLTERTLISLSIIKSADSNVKYDIKIQTLMSNCTPQKLDQMTDVAFISSLHEQVFIRINRVFYRTLSSDNMKVVQTWSVNMSAFSLMVHDGYVLLSSKLIRRSFYMCSQETLKHCLKTKS